MKLRRTLASIFALAVLFSSAAGAAQKASLSASLELQSDTFVAPGDNPATLTITNTGASAASRTAVFLQLPKGVSVKQALSDCGSRTIVPTTIGPPVAFFVPELSSAGRCTFALTIHAPSAAALPPLAQLAFSLVSGSPETANITTTHLPKISGIVDPSQLPSYSVKLTLEGGRTNLLMGSRVKSSVALTNTGKGPAPVGLVITLPEGFTATRLAARCANQLKQGERANEIVLTGNVGERPNNTCEASFDLNVPSAGATSRLKGSLGFSIQSAKTAGLARFATIDAARIQNVLNPAKPGDAMVSVPQQFITHEIDFKLAKDGVDSFGYDVAVGTPLATDNVYYYIQQYFSDESLYYSGIQPHSDGTASFPFSYFGKGATPQHPNCRSGADGGDGVSCALNGVPYKPGETYSVAISRTAHDATTQTYAAKLKTSTKTYELGSWKIPGSAGVLHAQGIAVIEKYHAVSSCADIPTVTMTYKNFFINGHHEIAYPTRPNLPTAQDTYEYVNTCTFAPSTTRAKTKQVPHGYQVFN